MTKQSVLWIDIWVTSRVLDGHRAWWKCLRSHFGYHCFVSYCSMIPIESHFFQSVCTDGRIRLSFLFLNCFDSHQCDRYAPFLVIPMWESSKPIAVMPSITGHRPKVPMRITWTWTTSYLLLNCHLKTVPSHCNTELKPDWSALAVWCKSCHQRDSIATVLWYVSNYSNQYAIRTPSLDLSGLTILSITFSPSEASTSANYGAMENQPLLNGGPLINVIPAKHHTGESSPPTPRMNRGPVSFDLHQKWVELPTVCSTGKALFIWTMTRIAITIWRACSFTHFTPLSYCFLSTSVGP